MARAAGDRGFFPLLDAMRWLAALAVVLFHSPDLIGFQLPKGYLAVDLFFVMSGVVVANAYEQRLLAGMSLRHFAHVRLARLYPLYLLGLGLGVLAQFIHPSGRVAEMGLPLTIAAGLLMIPRFWAVTVAGDPNSVLFPLNNPSWSLFFELAVNFAYARLLRHLDNRRIALILGVSVVVLVAGDWRMETLDLGWRPRQLPFGVVRTCFSFFAGVLIYRAGPLPIRLPRWPAALAILLLLGAALCASPGPALAPVYDALCILVLFPLLVTLALPLAFPPRLVRLFALAGTMSYALYILHPPCHEIAAALTRAGLTLGAPWNGLVFVGFMLGFCLAIDAIYDRPIRRWLGGLQVHRPESG